MVGIHPKVTTPPATPTVTSVTVKGPADAASPLATYSAAAGAYQLSATVVGTNNPAQTVTWAVTPAVAGASVSSTGAVTFTGAITGKVVVVATSTVDNTKSGSFEFTAVTA